MGRVCSSRCEDRGLIIQPRTGDILGTVRGDTLRHSTAVRSVAGRVDARALIVALTGAAVFLVGVALPFAIARIDRGREPVRQIPAPDAPPILEVIIPAYLEAGVIATSIERLRSQLASWPGEARITVLASDEDTATAADAAGATVRRGPPKGKPVAINDGVASSSADFVVLTDANCEVSPDDWPRLLHEEFTRADLVSASKEETGAREAFFWKYEGIVKRAGGADQPTMSVAGEFLAFRPSDYRPVPIGSLTDDLFIARDFAVRGLRVRVAHAIRTFEPPAAGIDQWERRVRIAAGVYIDALPDWRTLLTVPAGREFLAHKGYRMTIGVVGFWIAATAAAFILPPWSLVAVPAVVSAAVLQYTRPGRGPRMLAPLASVIALQVVPVLGAIRAARRRFGARTTSLGWKKIAR